MEESTRRILIVDDEPAIRQLLGEYMRQAGYDVTLAENGSRALEVLSSGSFDLMLSDVRMPGMNGLELLGQASRLYPQVAVLLLTACEDLNLAVSAMRIGAMDYILKPFRLPEVARSVKDALARKRDEIDQKHRLRLLEDTVHERTAELRRMLDKLNDASDMTLEALVAALDAREHETQAHSKRVSEYTLYLAREMSVDASLLEIIRRGSMLHDIGKIGISDAILLKPAKLTDLEWVEMQKHPRIGYFILDGIDPLSEASQIVLTHHERWDGCGYPNRMPGPEVPLGARIFSVMDCLDVMTSDRPYRKAADYDTARREIILHAGTQFDPDVVKYFLAVPQRVWDGIRENTMKEPRIRVPSLFPSNS